jgi:hypothetical protein
MMAILRRMFGYPDGDMSALNRAIDDQNQAVHAAKETTKNVELTMAHIILRDTAVTLDIVNRAMDARHHHQ